MLYHLLVPLADDYTIFNVFRYITFRSGAAAWNCRDYFVRAIDLFYSVAELTELLKRIGFFEVTSDNAPGGIVACHKAIKLV